MNGDSILKINNLKTYLNTDSGVIKAVDGIDLEIPERKIVGLLGESGCGKTMTALSILKVLPPTAKIISGSIKFDNLDLAELSPEELRKVRGKAISMIFQEPFSCLNPVIKAGRQIQDVINAHESSQVKNSKENILELLEKVNLKPAERFFNSYPHQLSGGERQRVMIAMAVALRPKVLIADEPTSALDATVQIKLLELLFNLRDQFKLSILFITHDLRLISRIADFVYVMYLGKIMEQAEKNELFNRPLHPYTQRLLKSLPRPELKGRPLETIMGTPLEGQVLSSGCVFHPRCPYAEELCNTRLQDLKQMNPNHQVRCWKAH